MDPDDTDLMESIWTLVDDFIQTHPTEVAEPDFHETLVDALRDILEIQMDDFMMPHKMNHFMTQDAIYEDWLEYLDDAIATATEIYYETVMPRRSHTDTWIRYPKTPEDIQRITQQIQYLRDKPQPKQRTDAWYETRYNLITASNAYKAFESQAAKNQLIYEKCQPIQSGKTANGTVNVNTAFHWGQKYEPLATLFYERLYKTRVGEFGCIQHDKYEFLGASPDGINIDPDSPRYGRLLEVKNIVNREIDGIPKKEYWVQMQLQMETCDLDECDFLEMRFVEYKDEEWECGSGSGSGSGPTSESDKTIAFFSPASTKPNHPLYLTAEKTFMMDGDSFDKTARDEYKGVILYFANAEGNPCYEYMPFHINTYEKYVRWEIDTIRRMEQESKTWIQNCFWRLEEFSCVLVERNRVWFENNVAELAALWDIVLEERVTGNYIHRCPNPKRTTEASASASASGKQRAYSDSMVLNNTCYLSWNKDSGKVSVNNGKTEEPDPATIKTIVLDL